MQFNEKLKELRTKKGVSQSELADGIYVSRSAVAKWENGLGLPSTESLRLLAEYFGVTVEELYADSSTEKVIVHKNKIISRSRKLLIIISTACAVAITAIIILAIFLGYHLNKPASQGKGDSVYNGIWGVSGELYEWEEFDDEIGFFTVPQSQWNYISSDFNCVIAPHETRVENYTLTAGRDYILRVVPIPSGWNGQEFCIKEAGVELGYNADIFDIVFINDYWNVYYKMTVKQPCQQKTIYLHRKSSVGEQITELKYSSCKMIITAAAPSEESL